MAASPRRKGDMLRREDVTSHRHRLSHAAHLGLRPHCRSRRSTNYFPATKHPDYRRRDCHHIRFIIGRWNFCGRQHGADLRLQSLHEHTGRLPLVGTQGDTPLWGYDTETALRSGSLQGIAYEIEGYIHECSKRYDELLVFLTGGDAERLAAMTKRVIFALKNEEIPQVPASRESTEVIFLDRNLVPKGLNRILEYNVEI